MRLFTAFLSCNNHQKLCSGFEGTQKSNQPSQQEWDYTEPFNPKCCHSTKIHFRIEINGTSTSPVGRSINPAICVHAHIMSPAKGCGNLAYAQARSRLQHQTFAILCNIGTSLFTVVALSLLFSCNARGSLVSPFQQTTNIWSSLQPDHTTISTNNGGIGVWTNGVWTNGVYQE